MTLKRLQPASSLARPLLLIGLILVLLVLGAQRFRPEEDEPVSRRRILMGTVVEITATGLPRDELDRLFEEAFGEIARIEALMSPVVEQSDVARLSRPLREVEVTSETAGVIALGLKVAEASGGAFDMALGRLKGEWGIEADHPRVPSPAEIMKALAGTGPEGLRLEGRRVSKADPSLQVDLGGIAKGYALDRAAGILREAGASAAVNAGGDMQLVGRRGDRPWRIGIQHPRRPEEILAVLPLADRAVVTSGDYERYFEEGGRRYHHLFDPQTGYPADRAQSVTVIAPEAALADALATAAFVLGAEEGIALLRRWPEAEGLIIDAEGESHLTGGMEALIEWR